MTLEDAVEKAIAEEGATEDLSDIDIALNDEQELIVYANERFKMAITYQSLHIQATNVRASIVANKAVGNVKAAEQYTDALDNLEKDMRHLLRGIKSIDLIRPKAKQRMIESQSTGKA